MSRDCYFDPLKRCSGCEKAFYHSEKCQKEEHWKKHKSRCRALAATPSVAVPFDYSQHPWMKALNVGDEYRKARLQWLLDPPSGSASYYTHKSNISVAPSLVRSLRPTRRTRTWSKSERCRR